MDMSSPSQVGVAAGMGVSNKQRRRTSFGHRMMVENGLRVGGKGGQGVLLGFDVSGGGVICEGQKGDEKNDEDESKVIFSRGLAIIHHAKLSKDVPPSLANGRRGLRLVPEWPKLPAEKSKKKMSNHAKRQPRDTAHACAVFYISNFSSNFVENVIFKRYKGCSPREGHAFFTHIQ